MPVNSRTVAIPAPFVVPATQQWDGNDGRWSTFYISIGTPGQNFRIIPSTATTGTMVPHPDTCLRDAPPNCPQLRGVEYVNGSASPGFTTENSSTWIMNGIYTLEIMDRLEISGNGVYGFDNVNLGSTNNSSATLSLGKQLVVAIASTGIFLGVFGLGVRSSVFPNLRNGSVPSFITDAFNQGKIPSKSYGYTAGARYRGQAGVVGSLILGGYDASRFTSSPSSFAFSDEDSLKVGVQSVIVTNSLRGVASWTASPSSTFYALIDSIAVDFWLPRPVCDLVESAFGLQYDDRAHKYWLNDTTRTMLLALNPIVTFKFSSSAHDTGKAQSTDIVLPFSAFDLNATGPYVPPNSSTAVHYFPMRRASNDTQYTLGRAFLQESYLLVDYERRNFSLHQIRFTEPPPLPQIMAYTPLADINETTTKNKDSGILHNPGVIAGISISAVVLVALVIAAGLFVIRRRRQRLTERHRSGTLDGFEKPELDGIRKEPEELEALDIVELSPEDRAIQLEMDTGVVAASELEAEPITNILLSR